MGKRKAAMLAEGAPTVVQPCVSFFPLEVSDADERGRRLQIMERVRERHLSSPDFLRSLSVQSRVDVKEVAADAEVCFPASLRARSRRRRAHAFH